MIVDLPRFIAAERPTWNELEAVLDRLERDPEFRLDLEGLKRFHYLYQKVSADLARIATFASEPALRQYLESLTARAYAEIHETREKGPRFALGRWFLREFPATFRRHQAYFWVACAIMLAGVIFGAVAVSIDPEAKEALIPFGHLMGDPAERVAKEEAATSNELDAAHASFSSMLMTHNIQVSIFTMGLGMTAGIGTMVSLFYNGVILGAVGQDYVLAGQTVFLLGWLLPHGVIEIPAILIAGQGGLLLGRALIGWGDRTPLRRRLRTIRPDLIALVAGLAVLLVWAGLVESFLSQYHRPVLPYSFKIGFGVIEFALLVWLLQSRAGTDRRPSAERAPDQ